MARPKKKGLDYFPVDTNILQNKKVRRLKRRAGHAAVVLYLQILCDCYANSYFVKWNDDYRLELSEQIEIQEDEIEKMVRLMVDLNLFDRAMFENNDVLTSVNIQNRYIAAKTQFLTNNEIDRTYLIVDFSSRPNVNGTLQRTKSAPGEGKSAQNKIEEKKTEENNLSLIPRASNTRGEEENYRKDWAEWREELLSDAIWQETLVRFSGKGAAVLQYAGEAMALFEDFIVLRGEIGSHRTKRDYQRSFLNWWRYNHWTFEMDVLRGQKTRQTAARPVARKLGMMDKAEAAAEKASVLALKFLNGEAI